MLVANSGDRQITSIENPFMTRCQVPGGLCCLNCDAGKLRLTNQSNACCCECLDDHRKLEATVSKWSSGWSRAVANSEVLRCILHLDIFSTLPQRLNLLALQFRQHNRVPFSCQMGTAQGNLSGS